MIRAAVRVPGPLCPRLDHRHRRRDHHRVRRDDPGRGPAATPPPSTTSIAASAARCSTTRRDASGSRSTSSGATFPFEQISTYFKDAVIAIEDHRFYSALRHRSDRPRRGPRSTTCARARARRAAARSRSSSRARCTSRTRGPSARKAQEAALAVMLEIFLSKKEILELYFNRVYLSGGVYGVESMSREAVRQAGLEADARRGGADRRHHPRARLLLAVDAFRRGPPPQLRRPAADARGEEDHGRAGADGARGADPHRAAVIRVERAARLREGIPAAAVPRHLRRRQPAGLESPHQLRARSPGRGRSRRARRTAAAWRARACRRRSSRWIRAPATCSRWSADPTSRSTPFNRAVRSRRQPGSAFKPFVYSAALEERHVAGLDDQRSSAGRRSRRLKASGFLATSARASRTR